MVRIGLRSKEASREVAFWGLLLFSLQGQDRRGRKEVQRVFAKLGQEQALTEGKVICLILLSVSFREEGGL